MVELRKESQQSLSPDQLASYIKVSKPSVWLLMGAIAALLVAGVVWFFAGTITENAFGVATVPGDGTGAAATAAVDAAAGAATATATVYLPLSGASGVESGDAVTLTRAAALPSGDGAPDAPAPAPAELTGVVLSVSEVPVSVSEVRDRCAGADFSAFVEDDWAVAVTVELDAAAEPGTAPGAAALDVALSAVAYTASIATAQHRPIRLLLGLE